MGCKMKTDWHTQKESKKKKKIIYIYIVEIYIIIENIYKTRAKFIN